jgi:hypothetical protein
MNNVDQIVAAINGLDENAKAELTGKLSASAAPRVQLKTLRAAAANPENHVGIAVMKAHARRLGVSLEEGKPVDIIALDKALAGKDITARLELKSMLYRLGCIAA